LKTELSSTNRAFISANIDVFVEVVILDILVLIQDKVDVNAVLGALPMIASVAKMTLNLNVKQTLSNFFSGLSCKSAQ